jgi:dihydropteroate synthase
MVIKYADSLIDFSQPKVMGIVNVTPDSFFIESRVGGTKSILKKVESMVAEGVDILDIGAYSSRPMAEDISVQEEMKRLSEALEVITKHFPDIPLSVDTFRAPVASFVLKNFRVGIINDISGGILDNNMFETIADLGVAYILMHIKGNPQTMQNHCDYSNVVSEVVAFLQKRVHQLHLLGVNDVIIDPGFGFAKTTEQNFTLLKNLNMFSSIQAPLLVGVSRKSMICKTLNVTPEQALNGTTAVHFAALMGGANILRVHDVKEAKQAIAIFEAMNDVVMC